MHRKIIWFCFFTLTSLELSLNTKLTAQGKSHGVIPEPLLTAEETPLKEWTADGGGGGGGGGVLRCSPGALALGARTLGAAHAASVTLFNAGNDTVHLTSISGSTPDFHASFFDTKTLPPAGNTSFSVVFLGRREGLARATLLLHTSLGVLHYNVSAVGAGAEFGLFPVRVRVALNAPVRPLLSFTNPTDQPVQIQEVYSSAHWLGLELPDGGGGAPAALWTLPPRSVAPLVRLRLRPPPPKARAYIRIKTNASESVVVVRVEAAPAPAGLWAQDELRAGAGADDPPTTLDVSVGNSADSAVSLAARVTSPRCAPLAAPRTAPAHDPLMPHAHDPEKENGSGVAGAAAGGACAAGAWCGGVRLDAARAELPSAPLEPVATLSLDWAQLWAAALEGAKAAQAAGDASWEGDSWAAEGALCTGSVLLGDLALPYSATVRPGGLHPEPAAIDFLTGASEGDEAAWGARELRVRNDLRVPLHIYDITYDDTIQEYFHVNLTSNVVVGGGAWGALGAVWPRAARPPPRAATLLAALRLRTNLTTYSVPVRLYSGRVEFEWDWPLAADGSLSLGALGVSQTRSVRGRLVNPGPAPLRVVRLACALPGAALTPPLPPHLLLAPGARAELTLHVVAPASPGAVSGALHADTGLARTEQALRLSAWRGAARLAPLRHAPAAPRAWSEAELRLDSSLPLPLRLLSVTQLPPGDPALLLQLECGSDTDEPLPPVEVPVWQPGAAEAEGVGALGRACAWGAEQGGGVIGRLLYAPERACRDACWASLDMDSEEGVAWAARGAAWEGAGAAAAAAADAAAAAARRQLFLLAPRRHNYTVHVRTDQVVALAAAGSVTLAWPRLVEGGAQAGRAGAGGVGATTHFTLRLRNPSASHPLLLQPRLAAPPSPPAPPPLPPALLDDPDDCEQPCHWSPSSFAVEGWRALEGAAQAWGPAGGGGTILLAPGARIELNLTLAPREPRGLRALLLLRNNLTLLDGALLRGAGVLPRWELGPPRGPDAPLLLEVAECGGGGSGGGGAARGGTVRRALALRNTGAVHVTLRPALAGGGCEEGGFSVEPCEPLTLPPNASARLTLAFTPDWTLARARRHLLLWAGGSPRRYTLHAAVPPRLHARCAARAPPPPFDAALRPLAAAAALVLALFALALAALDSETILKRAMAAMQRDREPPRHPQGLLDLRALGRAAPATSPPTPAPAQPTRHAPTRPAPPPPTTSPPRHSPLRPRPALPREPSPSPPPPPVRAAPHAQLPPPSPPTPPQPQKHKKKTKKLNVEIKTDLTNRVRDNIEASDEWKACATPTPAPAALVPAAPSAPAASTPRAPHEDTSSRSSGDASPPDLESNEDAASTGTDSSHGAPPPPPPRPEPRRRDKYHAKRDKPAKKRAPPAPAPRPAPPPPREPPPPPPPRRTATFSEVVAASPAPSPPARLPSPPPASAPPAPAPAPAQPAPRTERPLAPIGSDVRRRAPARTDNSLFYFNGEPGGDYGWEGALPPAMPPSLPPAPQQRYDDEYGSVWRSEAPAPRWGWSYDVRPPPGFPAPAAQPSPAPAAPPVRAYDPFHAMAAIWAPGRHAWTDDDRQQ